MGDQTLMRDLEAFVGGVREVVDQLAGVVAEGLADTAQRSALVAVEPLVREILGSQPMIHGAGFVAAPDVLSDAPWWLEWFAWDGGRIQRLVTDTDPEGPHFFDYTLMPWYADPLAAGAAAPGAQVVTGPYVDYLCTDDYTLTFTQAIWTPQGFAGVAGADVRVRAVEEAFLGALRASARLLVVANRLGRIVVSNSARLLSGDLLDLPAGVTPRPVAGSELALVDLGPRR